ncbi:MAG: hypothetical protein ONB32_15695, partial [candidate division KSB1 bacterium]|nr:hypothetical protein [candidate division KSB1 bacterium]
NRPNCHACAGRHLFIFFTQNLVDDEIPAFAGMTLFLSIPNFAIETASHLSQDPQNRPNCHACAGRHLFIFFTQNLVDDEIPAFAGMTLVLSIPRKIPAHQLLDRNGFNPFLRITEIELLISQPLNGIVEKFSVIVQMMLLTEHH